MKTYYVYILSSKKEGVLYVGMTSNLARRLFEHQQKILFKFTSKYHIKKLVYVEKYESVDNALAREKRLKHWKRSWKIDLIYQHNPLWQDLSKFLLQNT